MNTDNMQLTAIRRYAAGEDATAISRDMGMNDTWARVTVGRIRRADLAESGFQRGEIAQLATDMNR